MNVTELKDICRQNSIKGYSKLKKLELIKLIEENNIDTDNYVSSEEVIEQAAKQNRKQGRKGDIIVDKLCGRFSSKSTPILASYMSINVTSGNRKWGPGLSPMLLGPVKNNTEVDYNGDLLPDALIFENYYQSLKVYEIDVDKDGNILESYFDRKSKLFESEKGIRRPVKNSKCLYSYYNIEKLDYITARKKIYCPLYSKLVKHTDEYKELKRLHNEGYNLLLLDYDGYRFDDIATAIEDTTRPFGHGHVLYALLTNNTHIWDI